MQVIFASCHAGFISIIDITAHSAAWKDTVQHLVDTSDMQYKTQRLKLLADYDYELSAFSDCYTGAGESIDWERLYQIGPDVPLSQFSNTSVHRHPWLGTVLTICFLLGIVAFVMVMFPPDS